MKKPKLRILPFVAMLFACVTIACAGEWTAGKTETRRTLTYTGTSLLMGKKVPVSVTFGCDPVHGSNVFGTLGVDIAISRAKSLSGFPFTEFEGPDATAVATVTATVKRESGDKLAMKSLASGSFSEADTFTFGVAEVSSQRKSPARLLLQNLAGAPAESVVLSVADAKLPGNTLTIIVPVEGKLADFQKLISGLKP